MAKRTCSIEGCESPHYCRGWCNKHYGRWKAHGDPTKTLHRETCTVDGCDGKHEAQGYCVKHYQRWRNHGDPLYVEVVRDDDEARFWANVDQTDECWHWTGWVSDTGYGQFWAEGRTQSAHRYSFELLVGPIPEGLTIDHLCRVRHCVNPEHLEPVTIRENLLRGETVQAINARKTHCNHGHPFDEENTVIEPGGWRSCRECNRRRGRESYHRNKKGTQR